MRESFLPFSPPLIGEEEIQEVIDTLRSEWLTTGPKTKRFEDDFASYIGAPSALALNSCTGALHLSLVALGITKGDEVITTPLTFCATVNVIEHVGAKPVFVDVQPDTLNIDPDKVEKAITPQTKAILPVHYAGHPVDLEPIMDLARKHGLYVIEDAAHAVAAKYKGRFIGACENPVCFSFYATKNMTTGEGGMLTASAEFIEKARVLSLHGMNRDAWRRYAKEGSWYYEVVEPGFKYNMTDIQASIGIWQLRKLERFQARRREVARRYTQAFSEDDALEVPVERPYVEHSWHLYCLRLRLERLRIDRNQFIEELKKRNIGTSVHFLPIHMHPYYKNKYGFGENDYPVAYSNYLRMISIPLHAGLSDKDADDVIEAVLEVSRLYRR